MISSLPAIWRLLIERYVALLSPEARRSSRLKPAFSHRLGQASADWAALVGNRITRAHMTSLGDQRSADGVIPKRDHIPRCLECRSCRFYPCGLFGAGQGPSDLRDDKIVGPWAPKPHAHKRHQSVLDCRSYPREAKMIDWRNKTTNPQHVGVAVAKSRRSNFDGAWPPKPKPAVEPASKPADPRLRMPCGNDRCGSVSAPAMIIFWSGRRRRRPPSGRHRHGCIRRSGNRRF